VCVFCTICKTSSVLIYPESFSCFCETNN